MTVDINLKTYSIKDINGGDCFYYGGTGDTYLKLAEVLENQQGIKANAINLRTGKGVNFGPEADITPLRTKIVNY